MLFRGRAGSEAVDPIGVALSITAGKPKAHPRTGTHPLLRPHGGRTSCRRRADCVTLRGDHRTVGSLAAPRVCLRPTRGSGKLDPHGVLFIERDFPQVRLRLTRGYRKFAPYGGTGLAELTPPCAPRGRYVGAGLCPERLDARMASLLWRSSRADGWPLPPCPQRGFLTRRIDYFRALVPSLANTRKSERLGFQVLRCDEVPQRCPKTRILTLYGAFWGCFSVGMWPWMGISIPWIGRSMGWRWRSMGWIGRAAALRRGKFAGRRASVGVRFNGVPYSAQCLAAFLRLWRPAAGMRREVGPLWGPVYSEATFRGFACGSPAVIKGSPPMGARASRCPRCRQSA